MNGNNMKTEELLDIIGKHLESNSKNLIEEIEKIQNFLDMKKIPIPIIKKTKRRNTEMKDLYLTCTTHFSPLMLASLESFNLTGSYNCQPVKTIGTITVSLKMTDKIIFPALTS